MEKKLFADLVIENANVWTMEEEKPRAKHICVYANTIMKVSSDKTEIEHLIGPETIIIDAENKTVIPGFIDSHTHIAWTGLNKIYLDLGNTRSLAEALDLIKDEIEKKNLGEWIIGRNWDQSNWPEQRYITAEDLDPISPDNPVILRHVSGHMVTVNTLGFKRLGLSKDELGVDLDENGEIIGTLRDIDLSEHKEIRPKHADFVKGLELGMDECLKLGITSIHDNIVFELLPAYMELVKANKLKVRIYGIIYEDMLDEAIKLGLQEYVGSNWFRIGAVKLMTDGALSSRTAYLFEDYADKPGEKGFALYDEKKLDEMVMKVHEAGLQIAAHAIGGKAVSNVVDAILRNIDPEESKKALHRIEHAELVRKEELERSRTHGIVYSMQPNFVWRWGLVGVDGMYEQRLGKERTLLNNPFRWVLDNELILTFGSDGMPLGPLYGIKGALFHSNENLRLSLEEAIKCYTLNPAITAKEDKIKGSIKEGKLADLVILNKNLDNIELEEFHEVCVEKTIVSGVVVYTKEK
ncbi:MAG: amidohydrolase [Candidatus Heimdallarchaeaceae archaeon]